MSWRERIINLIPQFLLRQFASPYIAGNSLEVAIHKADQLWEERGICSTLDLLGEGIQSQEDAEKERLEYFKIIDAIGNRSHITISLKPTQLGLAFAPQFCFDNITQILERTEPHAIQVTIDMEESDFTEATLKLHQELRKTYQLVGTVLQSRLYRTEQDIEIYLSGIQAHIRLCIGIYNEPKALAFQKKSDMKENFVTLAEKLWKNGHFVAIATHDEKLIQRCLQLAKELDVPSSQFEVQMLLGVPRDAIQQKLLSQNIPVRLYVPYGTTWEHAYAYAKRRLLENPHIGLYTFKNIFYRLWQKLFLNK